MQRMGAPRILVIMGSGETAPTMAKVHRALFERLGPGPVPAAVLDTPYGFQENADELSRRTVEFFAASVGRPVAVATLRSRDVDPITLATAVGRIREAQYVMAGPGSPSYALRQWAGGPIPHVLADKLESGGILAMASAAALTVGVVTIPVYEVYKVGEAPRWLEGLDLLGAATGLRAAVVPHYDNAEGGTHDTRFCYMGERRLRVLEAALALVLDLAVRTAAVVGQGGVTVRVAGRGTILPSGSEVPIDLLGETARALAAGGRADSGELERAGEAPLLGSAGDDSSARRHLRDAMADLDGSFLAALDRGDTRAAVTALLDLESMIEARLRAGEDSPDLDSAEAMFRSLIARLGERADAGVRDPRAVLEPFVDTLLEVRSRARAAGDWPTADLVRERLQAAGVEVRDEPGGPVWLTTAPRFR
jgi:hypothetical protein